MIGSGSMLITTKDSAKMLDELKQAGINAAVIGKITDGDITVTEGDNRKMLAPPAADELFSI